MTVREDISSTGRELVIYIIIDITTPPPVHAATCTKKTVVLPVSSNCTIIESSQTQPGLLRSISSPPRSWLSGHVLNAVPAYEVLSHYYDDNDTNMSVTG